MLVRRASALIGAVAVAVVVFGACGDDDPYDVSCKVDGDCAIVPVAPGCACNSCSNTVINKKEVSRYNEDRQDNDSCNGEFGGACASPGSCPPQTAFCANGKCALR